MASPLTRLLDANARLTARLASPVLRHSAPGREVPERVRMPLLTLITQQSLDEGYAAAAERRAAGGPRPPVNRPRRTAAVMVAVFGVLVTTAAVQTHRDAGLRTESRDSLISRIDAAKKRVASLNELKGRLDVRNAAAQRALARLTGEATSAASGTTGLGVVTGFTAVHGPGVRVTVHQVANADDDTTVKDSDLVLLTDGLWSAGAEAISVNGQRLTAATAIRTSGAAIEVNGVGIAPPYTILAIGDTGTLQARFLDSTAGGAFATFAQDGYFSYTMDNESTLSLPAAPARLHELRSASTDLGDPSAPTPHHSTPSGGPTTDPSSGPSSTTTKGTPR